MKLLYHTTSKLREIVASNVFLYKVWFYSIRKNRGDYVRLPSRKDDFYFDGYPRSGNTFFKNFIKKIYPQKQFASHLHVISGLKIALELELPIFVMIRKPEDAVASNLYRKVVTKNHHPNELLVKRLLTSYTNYYRFVKSNINYINILQFELAVDKEFLFPKIIAEVLEFDKKSDALIKEKLDEYKLTMKKLEAQKETYASSLPNQERAKFKSTYSGKILNCPVFKEAESIYNKLVRYDLFQDYISSERSHSCGKSL